MTPLDLIHEWNWERGKWEVDIGVGIFPTRWGLGIDVDYFGPSSPNGMIVRVGPASGWITVWYWGHLP